MGAWIETCMQFGYRHPLMQVAPRVGAWIETDTIVHKISKKTSPLAWGRGLKRAAVKEERRGASRPSRGGVD